MILRIINRGTIKRVWYNGCTLVFHVNEDEFDSHYPLQLFSCSLAQLVECLLEAQKVTGSIPVGSTIFNLDVSEVLDKKKTLAKMIKLAKAGSGVISFLNKHPHV